MMEKYQGDLSDMIQGSGTNYSLNNYSYSGHEYFSSDPMMMMMMNFSSVLEEENNNISGNYYFGENDLLFSNMRDPFLHDELDFTPAGGAANYGGILEETASLGGGVTAEEKKIMVQNDDMKTLIRHNNNVNNCKSMIQISPRGSPVMAASSTEGNNINTGVVQISPPRNPALKRRKSEVKKSICIPAAAGPSSSRQSGEVVPCDMWAWRKYGQKPIKGSPYPRGYYRCSSSKGCPARKQVERSRIDPNMLVITYTSEHNHPWPTHRNALAGSTRSSSQPSNNNVNYSSRPASNNNSSESTTLQLNKPENVKQESTSCESDVSPLVAGNTNLNNNKGEMVDDDEEFAVLGEIKFQQVHSLNYFSSHQHFNNAVEVDDPHQQRDSKDLDPLFQLFDCSFHNI